MKGNTLLKSINQSIFVIGGLASVPLSFVFLRLGCYEPTYFFIQLFGLKYSLVLCVEFYRIGRNTENGGEGHVPCVLATVCLHPRGLTEIDK